MRRMVAKVLVAALFVSMLGITAAPEQVQTSKKPKSVPGISGVYNKKNPHLVIAPGQKRILRTTNVDKKTKVTFTQSKESKETAVVKWKKSQKYFEVTGKDYGTTSVTIRFTKKKTTTKVKLSITVWACRLPRRTPEPTPSAAPTDALTLTELPSAVPTQSPEVSAEPTMSPTPIPTDTPEPTATPEHLLDEEAPQASVLCVCPAGAEEIKGGFDEKK